MKPKDYNLNWNEIFDYSEDSPSGLIWKVPQYFKGTPNYDRVGKPVGSKLKNKNRNTEYWAVGLSEDRKRSTYLIHRIIWVMINGQVNDNLDIDHIDQNGLNNKIHNLRMVEKSINSRNKKKRCDNKSGVCGISYQSDKNASSEGWRAVVIDENGNKYTKYYSVLKYGYEEAKELAISWRTAKLKQLCNAGYTDIHGVNS